MSPKINSWVIWFYKYWFYLLLKYFVTNQHKLMFSKKYHLWTPFLTKCSEYDVILSKRVGKYRVFLGLAGLLLRISLGLCPRETPRSKHASPRKTPFIPPLLHRLTQYILHTLDNTHGLLPQYTIHALHNTHLTPCKAKSCWLDLHSLTPANTHLYSFTLTNSY